MLFSVLDPRLKLYYYEEHNWERKYIDEAKNLFSEIYYSRYPPNSDILQVDDDEDDLIAHIYKGHIEEPDEFELYIKASRAPPKTDILQWWKVS